jgi:hypothetical protein
MNGRNDTTGPGDHQTLRHGGDRAGHIFKASRNQDYALSNNGGPK